MKVLYIVITGKGNDVLMATHAMVVWAGGHTGVKTARKSERTWWRPTGSGCPEVLLF